jgi:hypothetical protein
MKPGTRVYYAEDKKDTGTVVSESAAKKKLNASTPYEGYVWVLWDNNKRILGCTVDELTVIKSHRNLPDWF